MKEFHIATEDGKNAKVGITRAKSSKKAVVMVTKSNEEVTNIMIHKGHKQAEVDSDSLIKGDPEIDMTNIGTILENGTRAFFKPGSHTIEGGFKVVDVITNPDGTEKERRDHVRRKANINDTVPVKIGKKMPIKLAFQQFVFHNHYALFHDDGLKFEYLYNLAKELHDKKEVALLGAGAKGNQPLVFIDSGSPNRGFLMGEVHGDKYRLLILLSKQELKMPKRELPTPKASEEKDKETVVIKPQPKGEILDI